MDFVRTVTNATTTAWLSSFKGGASKPMVRATVQRLDLKFVKYHLRATEGRWSGRRGRGKLATAIFGQNARPIELPNIKSVKWNRSIDQDLATCTLVLFNTRPLPLGTSPDAGHEAEFDYPGWYTHDRGVDATNPWGFDQNEWRGRIVPDAIIRTFEGYGFDVDECPEKDPNLYPSGVWRIDDVEYTHDGMITVQCRDIGSILADQILFPPVVPFHEYPLNFSTMTDGKVGRNDNPAPGEGHRPDPLEKPDKVKTQTDWFRPTYDTDSNQPYVGLGYTDGGMPYVQSNGAVRGHHGRHAFDNDNSTYWLSVGNLPNWSSAFEYVQGSFSSRDVFGVKLKVWGGPYRVYISVFADGEWKGKHTIPYVAQEVNTNADIRFVKAFTIEKGDDVMVKLPKKIKNAKKVRITLTDLYNTGIGYYRYRGGIRSVQVSGGIETEVDGGTRVVGNYKDYSDIVRWLCAWGGFYWPKSGHRYDYRKYADNTTETFYPSSDFDLFPDHVGGNVWGALEDCGTYGIVDLTLDIWDKKPILDGIKYVKDILGFNFYIDEQGGVIWRRPNIYKKLNYIYPIEGGPAVSSSNSTILTIDEEQTLLGLTARISSKNVRERVFVANVNGKFGSVVKGYNPYPTHLRRVAGWTDENFETDRECRVMARTIALRQFLTYREDTVIIPGHPGIQIDDQVQLVERVTGENYRHYVKSISSDFDMTQGKWTYTLGTHWLGDDPSQKKRWWFFAEDLDDAEKRYLGLL